MKILRNEWENNLVVVSDEVFDTFTEGAYVNDEAYEEDKRNDGFVESDYVEFYTEYGSPEGYIYKDATGEFYDTAWNGSNHITSKFTLIETVVPIESFELYFDNGITHDVYYKLGDGRILVDHLSRYQRDLYGHCDFLDLHNINKKTLEILIEHEFIEDVIYVDINFNIDISCDASGRMIKEYQIWRLGENKGKSLKDFQRELLEYINLDSWHIDKFLAGDKSEYSIN